MLRKTNDTIYYCIQRVSVMSILDSTEIKLIYYLVKKGAITQSVQIVIIHFQYKNNSIILVFIYIFIIYIC